MAQYDGEIRINTNINTQGFNTGLQKMRASLGKFAAVVGVAFSVSSLVKMGNEAINLASDITEVDNVVSKAFGSMRSEMDALADNAIKNLGMSRLTAYQTGSTFMSMGRSMLDSADDAKNMALALTSLTGNMASFYNVRQDIASTALKSIYTGETETLKQFGVVMTEVNLQQFAYEQGIKKTISAMNQSEKVKLRYKYVTEQLSFIGNDFIDTQDTWANQTRILTEQWKELLSVLGSGLISVLTPVVKGLNNIVAGLINVANAASKLLTSVFGVQAQQLAYNADSASDAADAMKDYGNATAEAARKAEDATAAFDDLDVLQQSNASSATVAQGTGSITTSTVLPETESITAKISYQLQWAMDKFKELSDMIKKIVSDFAKGDFFSAGRDVSGLASAILDMFSEAIEQVDWEKVGDSIGDFLEGIQWVEVLKSVGNLIWTAINAGVEIWASSFKAAPIETAIITGIALLKFTGLGPATFATLGTVVQGSLSTVLSSAVSTAAEAAILEALTWYFGSEAIEAITGKEGWADTAKDRGFLGTMEDIGDAMGGLPATFGVASEAASALSAAYDDIANGMIYTDEQMAKMQDKWSLSADEMETLRQAMLCANPELMDLADSFTFLYDASVDTLKQIYDGMELVADGTVSASTAFDEFSKPMWNMKDEALAFFKVMQDGSSNMKNVVAENVSSSGITMKNNVESSLSETDIAMAEWLNRLGGYSEEAGKNTVEGYNEGLKNTFGESKRHLDLWSEDIIKNFHDGPLKFGSPSKTMQGFGEDSIAGYNNGVLKSATQTKATLNKWSEETVLPFFSTEKWKVLGENVRTGFTTGFVGVESDVNGILNAIISSFEVAVNQLLKAINLLINSYNTVENVNGGSAIPTANAIQLDRIPHLATGAVIPPNKQFLAVLGDQTNGVNVETPLSVMEEAMQNVLERNSVGSAGGKMVVIFEMDGKQFAKQEVPFFNAEQQRIGVNFRTK